MFMKKLQQKYPTELLGEFLINRYSWRNPGWSYVLLFTQIQALSVGNHGGISKRISGEISKGIPGDFFGGNSEFLISKRNL